MKHFDQFKRQSQIFINREKFHHDFFGLKKNNHFLQNIYDLKRFLKRTQR